MTQSESSIEQINLGFNEEEDRLLLKIGLADKTEIAVWISRRVCKSIWSLLQSTPNTMLSATVDQLTLPSIATQVNKNQAIEIFAREVDAQKKIEDLDFKSEYVVDRHSRTEAPMLAVQCVIISSENLPPQLEFQCRNGQSVKMALTHELVHALSSMMQLATREAGWDLLMQEVNTRNSTHSVQQTLH